LWEVRDFVSAIIAGAAGLVGAWIGARATRGASREAFEREIRREQETWRRALSHECVLNVRLSHSQPPNPWWSPDTRFLEDSFVHAGAFTAEELERIGRIREHGERLSDAIKRRSSHLARTADLRNAMLGEIGELEVSLRSPLPPMPKRHWWSV